MTMKIDFVYVIYSADVISESTSDIENMSPALYLPAGRTGERKEAAEQVAARFTQTEGDEEYDYGYLAIENGNFRYFPYGYKDTEGIDEASDEEDAGQGQHRKWVAELSFAEWEIFADGYLIDLDANGIPERYEDTLGSITEYGHLPAISIDNSEGWNYGYSDPVLDSRFYVSFADTSGCESDDNGTD